MTQSHLAEFQVRRPTERHPVSLPPSGQFIDGQFVNSRSQLTLTVENPATEQTITTVCAGSAEDVDAAVSAAVAAKDDWAATTPKERATTLLRVASIVEENRQLFEDLEAENTGKPAAVAKDDVLSTIDVFRFMAGAARALTSMAAGDYSRGHTSVILREPVGVVGVITPWNYPLLMAAWKLAPILAAGNTVVLKPAEQTPLSTLKLAELTAGELPAGVLNVVTGRGDVVGRRISEHPNIDLVAVTGSTVSGRKVAEAASATLKRVHLELGGKAPVVVFEDADLAAAARGVRFAGFWNSGQECGAACRVLVHESVAEKFSTLLVDEVRSMVVGAPGVADDVEVGPMISREHYRRVLSALDGIRQEGYTVAIGGRAIEGAGYFIEPTVVTDVPAGTDMSRSEIFGPIVSIERFTTDEEAIQRSNETPYGLAASVWSTDPFRCLDVPRLLDFGTVWVNSHLVVGSELPWGGFKGSGYGRDLSLYALEDFSRTKHVMLRRSDRGILP